MRIFNKQKLYERIMTNVAREVKLTLEDNRVQPTDKKELKEIIDEKIQEDGRFCDLNFIDTSLITDMSYLFYGSRFNGDISEWDVSNVKDMSYMFANSNFGGDISLWDVSNVENMQGMFYGNLGLSSDMSNWDVHNVRDMQYMFKGTQVCKEKIANWDINPKCNTEEMESELWDFDWDKYEEELFNNPEY